MALEKIVFQRAGYLLLQAFLFIAPRDHITIVIDIEDLLVYVGHADILRLIHLRMAVGNARTTDGHHDRGFVQKSGSG